MSKKLWKKILTTFVSTIVILNVCDVKVHSQERQSTNDLTATTSSGTEGWQERVSPVATTLNHQFKGKPAVTLRVKNIPIFTFIGQNSQAKSQELLEKINQLQPESLEQIKVTWQSANRSYSIKINSELLVELNKTVFLSDTTKNPKTDAIQAANRLIRLLGNSSSLVKVEKETSLVKVQRDINYLKVRKKGVASWYGPGFHGNKTANGERFNSKDYTAAHKTLPFGTKVKVTNLSNGRSVIVRINDRGPFIKGREIDLSAQAARVLEISGIAQVKLEVVNF